MIEVFKHLDTAGKPFFGPLNCLECSCGSTGGCQKCMPTNHGYWDRWDIELAEQGMDEYNEILKAMDKE